MEGLSLNDVSADDFAFLNNDGNNINGGTGADSLTGGAGDDTIDGGGGSDNITGGQGSDILTGGAGADIFIFNAGDGTDVITDFTPGEDLIELSGEFPSQILTLQQAQGGALLSFSETDGILLLGLTVNQISPDDFIVI